MAKKDTAPADEPGFEQLLAEAEDLAEKMEDGGLSLQDSLAAYEKGVANLRRCADMLRAAEDQVKILLEKNGSFRLEDLRRGGADDEDTEEGY